jgi:hypothetical protein
VIIARAGLVVAIVTHLALSLTYAWRTPAWEGPDENDHAYYASFLAATGAQPTILQSAARTGRPPYEEGSLGHHPPLYYYVLNGVSRLLGSGDYTPCWSPNPAWGTTSPLKWRHGFDEVLVSREIWMLRAQRALSALLGAVSVLLAWLLARSLLPSRPAVAATASLLLACLPQWSWMHGVLDNGNLATVLAGATLLLLVHAMRARRMRVREGGLLGVLLGTALLTKLTALYLLPVVALAYGWALATWRGQRAAVLSSAALALALTAAICGAWFVRNTNLYGDVLALAPHAVAYASNRVPEAMRLGYLAGDFIWHTLQSTLAGIGWSGLRAPRPVGYGALALAAVALLACAARARALAREAGAGLWLALAALVFTVFGLVQFNLSFFQPQGRYLFPALGVGAILVAAGWHELRLPRALNLPLAAGLVLGAFTLQHAWFLPALAAPPVQDPRYASSHEGLRTPAPAALATIDALSPVPDARLDAAPTFAWHDPDAQPQTAYSVIIVFPSGVPFAAFETGYLALQGGQWQLPPGFWHTFPLDAPVRWRVRRIADRARGEHAMAQPTSEERTLVRTR